MSRRCPQSLRLMFSVSDAPQGPTKAPTRMLTAISTALMNMYTKVYSRGSHVLFSRVPFLSEELKEAVAVSEEKTPNFVPINLELVFHT